MMDVNYKFVVELTMLLNNLGKKLVHISTDYVYSNSVQYVKKLMFLYIMTLVWV